MDHDDDGETSYNTFVDDVAFEPTYSQALLAAAGRNVATIGAQRGADATTGAQSASPCGRSVATGAPTWLKMTTTGTQHHVSLATIGAQRASPTNASPSGRSVVTAGVQRHVSLATTGRNVATTGAPTWMKMTTTGAQRASPMDASPSGCSVATFVLFLCGIVFLLLLYKSIT